MTRRLVLAMALVAGLVAAALAIPLAAVTATFTRDGFVHDLSIETLAAASVLSSQPVASWPATVDEIAARTGARVVVVDGQRVLVADSEQSPVDRSFERPEIVQALSGELASEVRPSVTLGTDLRLVAAPVVKDERIVAAVRLSLPEDEVDAAVLRTQLWLGLFVVAVMTAAALLAWVLARSVTAPLRRLAETAAALPDDLTRRAPADDGPAEVRAVAGVLNVTAERLDGMLARTRRVAADASHHLRTPLTGVRLRLEAIEDISAEEPVRREAGAALGEVDRLARRIDQIIDLTRSDSGATPVVDIDASAVVLDRSGAASVIADERGLRLDVDVQPDVRIESAPGTLPRIVDELLGNAFGYARTTVRVALTADDCLAELVIEDDGPGLPAEEAEAVFTRFVRGAAAVPGGSGLGLALVRESARALGGDAVAGTSALGGLRVQVTWPVAG